MAETTISDLYEKYTNQVGEALEDDRYFQYLFEMVQAGDNTLEQKNRILHKVIDEQWLTVVEEGIEAIFNIVDKPRRFIATSEEVVPVALAKKITADSVRHLSQHTQFITENAAGEIQPTRILNVTTCRSRSFHKGLRYMRWFHRRLHRPCQVLQSGMQPDGRQRSCGLPQHIQHLHRWSRICLLLL